MIEHSDLIDRWINVERVLEAMPDHERRKHWDMSTWGRKAACGTIACAAGHCGLDPWFRERGFTLDFNSGGAEISNVEGFFGFEGAWKIFFNSAQRPVESVINEVQVFVRDAKKEAELAALAPCRIGDVWPDQGGVFAGARLGPDNDSNYFLIVGPEHEQSLTWNGATEWATTIEIDGNCDFRLPYLKEQRALIDRVRSLFQMVAYWSCEQHAEYSSHAYYQHFNDGSQYHWRKYNKLRARAVRSLPIR